ncbi:MAG: hypothetical protein ABEN55_05015, partial [Bradymonadaceae bacterium]
MTPLVDASETLDDNQIQRLIAVEQLQEGQTFEMSVWTSDIQTQGPDQTLRSEIEFDVEMPR